MPLPAAYTAVRMLWQDDNVAIAETYFNTATLPAPSPAAIYNTSKNLYTARSALMGASVIPLGFRMSLVSNKIGQPRAYVNSDPVDISGITVGSLPLTAALNGPQVAAGIGATVDGSSAQGPDAIIVNFIGTAIQNHSRHYLAGVPDVLIRENPKGPWTIGIPSWNTLFGQYRTILQSNGWVMRVRTYPTIPDPPATISSYFVDPLSATYLAVTAPSIAPVPAVGTMLQIRGAKMTSRAYNAPNGSWPLLALPTIVGASSTYVLGQTQHVSVFAINPGFGSLQVVDYSLVPYVIVNIGREGTHKRGNRVLAGPGRRRVVPKVAS